MKVLFVLDHIFHTKKELVYSDKFSYDILNRYISVFSNVTVVARQVELQQGDKKLMASGKGVKFVFLESVTTINSFFGARQKVKKIISELISEHNGLIVRLPSEYGLMAAKIAEERKVNYAVEVVGCAFDSLWNYGNFTGKFYAPYLYFKMKSVVKKSNHTLYVTELFLQKRYSCLPTANVISVSNVEINNCNESILKLRLDKISNRNNKFIFGTIGSLKTRYKGIHLGIQALSKITDFDFEYHILGEGYTKDYIDLAKKLDIEGNLFFDGVLVDRDDLFNWLDNIDIYLQPSYTEGLPRALIEAMSRACPSIGSNVGGIPELLEKNLIFETKNSKQLANAIIKLVGNKKMMKRAAINNFDNSKKYQKELLDIKRSNFWYNFKNVITKELIN